MKLHDLSEFQQSEFHQGVSAKYFDVPRLINFIKRSTTQNTNLAQARNTI